MGLFPLVPFAPVQYPYAPGGDPRAIFHIIPSGHLSPSWVPLPIGPGPSGLEAILAGGYDEEERRGEEELVRRHGYAAYAALGGLMGAAMMAGFQVGPLGTPWSMGAAAVVGALFGAAVRDALQGRKAPVQHP